MLHHHHHHSCRLVPFCLVDGMTDCTYIRARDDGHNLLTNYSLESWRGGEKELKCNNFMTL